MSNATYHVILDGEQVAEFKDRAAARYAYPDLKISVNYHAKYLTERCVRGAFYACFPLMTAIPQ